MMSNTTSMEREIGSPPGWWWQQRAAALLEAERQCPIDVASASIDLTRIGRWQPNTPGQFRAVYARRAENQTDRATMAAGRSPLLIDVPLLAAAVLLAVFLTVPVANRLRAANAIQTIVPTTPTGSQPDNSATETIATVDTFLLDLRAIAQATKAGSMVTSIEWTPERIALQSHGLDTTSLNAYFTAANRELITQARAGVPEAVAPDELTQGAKQ